MVDFVVLPITYKCNLQCAYCRERLKNETIDIQKSINMIKKMQEKWVFITGGEPLLVPDLLEICDDLRKLNKKVGITTNGTIPNYDIIKHVDRLGVSIDGPEKIHNDSRGKDTYDKAFNFLKFCVGKVETVMMATIHDGNKNNLNDINNIAEEIGVDWLQLRKCI